MEGLPRATGHGRRAGEYASSGPRGLTLRESGPYRRDMSIADCPGAARRRALAPILAAALVGCGGGPPRSMDGFSLGMSREEVLAEVRSRGGFTCSIRGTRPSLTLCEGPTSDGSVRVVVRQDSVVEVTVRTEPPARSPQRAMQRLARRFGEPAWRERPYPPRPARPEGYHSLWLSRDSTRSVAMLCQGERLTPPCTIELAATSPASIQAKLDSLLQIRR